MSKTAFSFIPASQFCSKVVDGTHESPKAVTVGKPLITSKHIKGRNIDFENAYLISLNDFTSINKRSQVYQWDVIISMIGEYCGYCYVERNENVDYAIKNVGVFRAGSQVNAEWLYYYLNSPIGKSHLRSCRGGSSQPYLSLGALRSLPILVPASEDQKKQIVHVLSTLDAKIELNNRINEELEGMAKLLYDYWFVQFDFPITAAQAAAMGKPRLEGKPYRASGGKMIYNESLKRAIPKGWSEKVLNKLVGVTKETVNPSEFPEKPFQLFSIPEFDSTGTYSLDVGSEIGSNKFLVNGRDILVSKLNPWFSRVVYTEAEIDAVCSTEFVVWKTSTNWMKAFLYMVATSPQFICFCTQSATGTSNSHKRINPEVMMSHAIPWDPDTVKDFGDRVGSLLLARQKNQSQNKTLTELRDWLLPMLMNGQVTVT